jgi:hypothetical protein
MACHPAFLFAKEGNMRKPQSAVLILALTIFVAGLGMPRAAAARPGGGGPDAVTVPAGTDVTVRMIDSVDSSRNHAGDEFAATIANAVAVGNQVAIPKGAEARVRLVESKSAGHIKGQSELALELVQISFNGNTYTVESGIAERKGASRGKRSAALIGGGAGVGALIGAVAGGGKGAATGAAIGAGGGTAVELATHGQKVKVPAESKVDFTLRQDVSVNL